MEIAAYSRCTQRQGFEEEPVINNLRSGTVYGPDAGWVLLTLTELETFCAGEGRTLQHMGKSSYNHVCAAFSGWAFDAQDASHVCCVVFMHYHVPRKLQQLAGNIDPKSGVMRFVFTGADLLSRYKAITLSFGLIAGGIDKHGRAVHVWKRAAYGEIAIDFCMAT